MSREQDHQLHVRSIHLDLEKQSLTIRASDESQTRFRLAPEGILFERIPADQPATSLLEEKIASDEKEPILRLKGKLKHKPKEGREDSSGKPTACASFAAHELDAKGQSRPHMYYVTFHGVTRDIALGLEKDASVEIEGHPHPKPAPDRLETFSAYTLRSVPEKGMQRPAQ